MTRSQHIDQAVSYAICKFITSPGALRKYVKEDAVPIYFHKAILTAWDKIKL